ncbi:MAG: N-terminal phage integrase SAM-like domain-containing protein [Lawsonibacter sp.]
MESIVRPNRAETTVYAYQKIIDNHILPALGGIPMSRLSAKRIQRYYTDTQQDGRAVLQHHAAAPRPSLQRPALRGAAGYAAGSRPWTGWSRHGPGLKEADFYDPGGAETALRRSSPATGWSCRSSWRAAWVCGGRSCAV